jgi:hypothetical protein
VEQGAGEEVPDQAAGFFEVALEQEVPAVQEVNLRVGQVSSERRGAGVSPHGQQRDLAVAEAVVEPG